MNLLLKCGMQIIQIAFAVEMWNANNSDSYVQIRENELGEIIMPDYSIILPYK